MITAAEAVPGKKYYTNGLAGAYYEVPKTSSKIIAGWKNKGQRLSTKLDGVLSKLAQGQILFRRVHALRSSYVAIPAHYKLRESKPQRRTT